jgi:hypothetical protein
MALGQKNTFPADLMTQARESGIGQPTLRLLPGAAVHKLKAMIE